MTATIEEIIRIWEADGSAPESPANWFCELARQALTVGHPSLSYDIVSRGAELHPENRELTYLAGLALARAGSISTAIDLVNDLLASLKDHDPLTNDTLSLAGRLAKDRYQRSVTNASKDKAARDSAFHYRAAFDHSGDYFPGINAATMSLLAGEQVIAREIAAAVLKDCQAEITNHPTSDYWLAATLGEAHVLLGNQSDAAHWYRQAAAQAGTRVGDIASMRRQLLLLNEVISVDDALLEALDVPTVAAFAGHMLDAPGRDSVRFPASLESAVTERIRATLDQLNAGFGYASAACGGDIIFLEQMLARGGEIHVVLPFQRAEFVQTSVAFAGQQWIERFDSVLSRATDVTYATTESYLGDDVLFRYTGDLINGLALLRAERLASEAVMLALMHDPTAETGAEKIGGTADNVSRWQETGKAARVIDLGAMVGSGDDVDPVAKPRAASNEPPRSKRDVRTMLFADVVGFSKLREAAAPSFFVEFLGQVAETIDLSSPAPAFCNTWGDGLFIVFESLVAGADFSLRLRDMVVGHDWAAVGLPEDTNIRIALHAGPVYRATDPIIHKDNFFGAQVNRAARIEPITAPGSVFVSEQTACLLAAEGADAYACDYLGVMALAKKFGSGALYRLRRADEIE